MLIASTAGAGIPCMCIIVKLHLGCTKFNNLIPTMEKMLAQYPLFHSCFHEQYKATKGFTFVSLSLPLMTLFGSTWLLLLNMYLLLQLLEEVSQKQLPVKFSEANQNYNKSKNRYEEHIPCKCLQIQVLIYLASTYSPPSLPQTISIGCAWGPVETKVQTTSMQVLWM